MGIVDTLRALLGLQPACVHLTQIADVTPSSPDACRRCTEVGDEWVQLRICLTCGEVSCCDNSKNAHATRHFQASGHPIIASYQPGEAWRFCYADETRLPDRDRAFRP